MTKPQLHTILSPTQLKLYDIEKSIMVIIDVFRATSTIAAALYNGAKCVIPVDTVDKAISISKSIEGIAAGERDGKIAEGLTHGNSPLEYPAEFITDRTLVLTTTNGTKLLHLALQKGVDTIVTASFPNIDAVCAYLLSQNKDVILGCSGWKDRFNLEDTLCAGAIINKVKDAFTIHCDSSLMAESLYRQHEDNLPAFSTQFTHYHRLVKRMGLQADIDFCLTPNIANVLPLYKDGKLIVG